MWETRNSITLTSKADKTWPLKETRSQYLHGYIHQNHQVTNKLNLKINKEDYIPLGTIIESSYAMSFNTQQSTNIKTRRMKQSKQNIFNSQ